MMNLVIDIGNTLAKVAVFQNNELLERASVAKNALAGEILKIYSGYPEIEGVLVSDVSNTRIDFPASLLEKAQLFTLDSDLSLPFINAYATPGTLGNDRKALVAAAAVSYPNQHVLVIDAGTCITYDFKDSENRFKGGSISPGIRMRARALHTFTEKLPLVELNENFSLVGEDTVSSIQNGVINGVLKEIDGIIEEYQEEFGEVIVIITGGDAQFLSRNLKNSIFANSNFLLEGLNQILEFNISQ